MPSGYDLDSLPVPLDPRVVLREEPARLMAVRSYSGRWTEANYRENESLLLEAVEKAGFKHLTLLRLSLVKFPSIRTKPRQLSGLFREVGGPFNPHPSREALVRGH